MLRRLFGMGAALAVAALPHLAHAQCAPLPLSQNRCPTPAYLSSQWISVYPNEGKVYHVLEGTCISAFLTLTDDCLSHDFYDYNQETLVDPNYRCLIADGSDQLHCEREAISLPQWVWPTGGNPADRTDGDHVWMAGPFIYDCGHCDGGSDLTGCYTEIHPILALASIRNRPDTLAASGTSGAIAATRADIWISGDAGCANAIQCGDDNANCGSPWPTANLCGVTINPFPVNKNWHITMALPPRPSPTALPVWRFEARPGDGLPSIVPSVTLIPALLSGGPRDSLAIDIDMTSAALGQNFGRGIVAGWKPGWSVTPIHHFQVALDSLLIYDDLDAFPAGVGEWYFSVDVNGVWQQLLGNIRQTQWTDCDNGQVFAWTNKVVDLYVPDDGQITLNSTGFDDDSVLGCTILNGDPGQVQGVWNKANGWGLGYHATRNVGGDNNGGACELRYKISEIGLATAVRPDEFAPGPWAVRAAGPLTAGRAAVALTLIGAAAEMQRAVTVRIVDAGGKVVRTLVDGAPASAHTALLWDGRDTIARPVASGVYLAVVQVDGRDVASTRVLVMQ